MLFSSAGTCIRDGQTGRGRQTREKWRGTHTDRQAETDLHCVHLRPRVLCVYYADFKRGVAPVFSKALKLRRR